MTQLIAHIVVDASIARSASDPARHPVTVACLSFARVLEKKSCSTGAIMTPALQDEWRRHASRMMTSWLVSMEQRGRVRREKDRVVRDLRVAVKTISNEGIRVAIEKDLHLSEAAVLHGVPVASLDDRQRRFLKSLSEAYPTAGRIQWLNPATDSGWETWLEGGCSDTQSYRTSDA